jgi:hypothetical protein
MASGLARIVDPAYRSNRFVLIVMPLAGAIAGGIALASGSGVGSAAGTGVRAGGLAFLAWAIGRELDHDHPLTACIAAVLAPWFLLVGTPDLIGSGLLLIAGRITAGTTGRELISIDLAALVLGGAYAATRPAGPVFVAAAVAALLLVAWYQRSTRVITVGTAAVVAIVGTGAAWWAGRGPVGDPPTAPEWILLALAVAAGLLAVVFVAEIVTPADAGAIVHHVRVRWARAITVAASLGAWAWIGGAGVAAAGAAWTAVYAIPIAAVGARLRS